MASLGVSMEASMTRLWPEGEPIRMHLDEQGRPMRFFWRGRLHRLVKIQQQWHVDTDWWGSAGRVWRAYVAVTTAEGVLCVVYQDFMTDMWYLAKVYD